MARKRNGAHSANGTNGAANGVRVGPRVRPPEDGLDLALSESERAELQMLIQRRELAKTAMADHVLRSQELIAEWHSSSQALSDRLNTYARMRGLKAPEGEAVQFDIATMSFRMERVAE